MALQKRLGWRTRAIEPRQRDMRMRGPAGQRTSGLGQGSHDPLVQRGQSRIGSAAGPETMRPAFGPEQAHAAQRHGGAGLMDPIKHCQMTRTRQPESQLDSVRMRALVF